MFYMLYINGKYEMDGTKRECEMLARFARLEGKQAKVVRVAL